MLTASRRAASAAAAARWISSPSHVSAPNSPIARRPTSGTNSPPRAVTAALRAARSPTPSASSTATMRCSPSGMSCDSRGPSPSSTVSRCASSHAGAPDDRCVASSAEGGWIRARASPISAIVGHRSSAALASAFSIAWASGCGVAGPAQSGLSSSIVIASIVASGVSRMNGGRPVKSSYRSAPSDHTSVRLSTSRVPRTCSGDMYAGVPSTPPSHVRRVSAVVSSAMPKSRTLIVPSVHRNRFDGLRSRWTMSRRARPPDRDRPARRSRAPRRRRARSVGSGFRCSPPRAARARDRARRSPDRRPHRGRARRSGARSAVASRARSGAARPVTRRRRAAPSRLRGSRPVRRRDRRRPCRLRRAPLRSGTVRSTAGARLRARGLADRRSSPPKLRQLVGPHEPFSRDAPGSSSPRSGVADGALDVRLGKRRQRELESDLDCGRLCRGLAREVGARRLAGSHR